MSEGDNEVYEFSKFRLDVRERLLFRDGERIPMPEKAFETLCVLVRRNNRLVRKDELLNEVWQDSIVEENNLDKSISHLRQVLGERTGEGKFIETVRGHGFRFVADVIEIRRDSVSHEAIAKEQPVAHTAMYAPTETDETSPISGSVPTLPSYQTKTSKVRISNLQILLIAGFVLFAILTAFYFRSRRSNDTPLRTVAVLPFKSLVASERDEALELGMADALILKLSEAEQITVRPLSAIRRYNSPEQDSIAAGRELGAEVVLEGNLQKAADRIRLSARLLRVNDGKQLWAGQFDEKFTDIFTVQDTISERVANALKVRLANKENRHDTDDVEAYQLYMKGRYHALRLTRTETDKAISYFEQAKIRDPNYAPAYVGLARAYLPMALTTGVPSEEVMPKAKAAVLRAIEIDPNSSEAHATLGYINFWYDWDWRSAETEYRRAIDLDPKNSDAHFCYAHLLSNRGQQDKALEEIKRARELDPLSLVTYALEGQIFFFAHRYEEALDRLKKTIDLEPNFWLAHLFISRVYTEKGMHAEAVAEAKTAGQLSRNSQSNAYRAYALSNWGKLAEAQSVLDELLKLSTETYVPPYNIALAYNAVGKKDKAIDYLKKGIVEKDARMVFLPIEPQWDNLRSDQRFVELVKAMKLN